MSGLQFTPTVAQPWMPEFSDIQAEGAKMTSKAP